MTCEKTDTESARADAQNGAADANGLPLQTQTDCNNACSVRELQEMAALPCFCSPHPGGFVCTRHLALRELHERAGRSQPWRVEPPVVAEVSACEWWWYRQRGQGGHTALQVLHLLVDSRVGTGVCVWDGDGSVRPFSIEEYGDNAEFMPCLPGDLRPQLTDAQREALAYVRDLVSRNLIAGAQDPVSKRHTAMVRAAVETIDGLVTK